MNETPKYRFCCQIWHITNNTEYCTHHSHRNKATSLSICVGIMQPLNTYYIIFMNLENRLLHSKSVNLRSVMKLYFCVV